MVTKWCRNVKLYLLMVVCRSSETPNSGELPDYKVRKTLECGEGDHVINLLFGMDIVVKNLYDDLTRVRLSISGENIYDVLSLLDYEIRNLLLRLVLASFILVVTIEVLHVISQCFKPLFKAVGYVNDWLTSLGVSFISTVLFPFIHKFAFHLNVLGTLVLLRHAAFLFWTVLKYIYYIHTIVFTLTAVSLIGYRIAKTPLTTFIHIYLLISSPISFLHDCFLSLPLPFLDVLSDIILPFFGFRLLCQISQYVYSYYQSMLGILFEIACKFVAAGLAGYLIVKFHIHAHVFLQAQIRFGLRNIKYVIRNLNNPNFIFQILENWFILLVLSPCIIYILSLCYTLYSPMEELIVTFLYTSIGELFIAIKNFLVLFTPIMNFLILVGSAGWYLLSQITSSIVNFSIFLAWRGWCLLSLISSNVVNFFILVGSGIWFLLSLIFSSIVSFFSVTTYYIASCICGSIKLASIVFKAILGLGQDVIDYTYNIPFKTIAGFITVGLGTGFLIGCIRFLIVKFRMVPYRFARCGLRYIRQLIRGIFDNRHHKKKIPTNFPPSSEKSIEESIAKDCVICMDREKCELMLPCRHLCVCKDCAVQIFRHDRKCPVCRKTVQQTITVFI